MALLRIIERSSGVLLLVAGLTTGLVLGFGPWNRDTRNSPAYGMLGRSPDQWLSFVAIYTVWCPLLCVVTIALGAIVHETSRHTWLPRLRWIAVTLLTVQTFLVLATAPIGVFMLPQLVFSVCTAIIIEKADRSVSTRRLHE